MGTYPQVELTQSALEKEGYKINVTEIHQPRPRMARNNLIFHKVNKIVAHHFNFALITDKGELLLQGMNDHDQLALAPELSKHL